MYPWINVSKAGVGAAVVAEAEAGRSGGGGGGGGHELEAPPAINKMPIYTNYIYYDISWMNDVLLSSDLKLLPKSAMIFSLHRDRK